MKAMVMAAGLGSRLMPLTTNIPKPMVPVANRPVMQYGLELLKKHQITEVIANVHYLPQEITSYFGDGSALGIKLNYAEEKKLLGTAGGVKNNQAFLNDTFVVLSGDCLTNIDLSQMLKVHKEKGALATIALKVMDEVEHYGVVILDEEDKIMAFQEKPKKEEALSNLVNTGVYIFEPEIFKLIPEASFYDFGRDLFPELVKLNLPFYGYVTEDYWCDIGTIDVYRNVHSEILAGTADVLGNQFQQSQKAWLSEGAKLGPGVSLQGRILIGKNSVVHKNVQIFGDVVIGANCEIAAGTIITDSVLWDNVKIGSHASLLECIIGKKTLINNNTVIGRQAVISDSCIIGAHAKVIQGYKMQTNSVVSKYSVAGQDII